MNTKYKQSQFELFPGTPENSHQKHNRSYSFKDLTLSPENIIVLGVISVMVMVLSYSFGVEKGKVASDLNSPETIQTKEVSVQTSVPLAENVHLQGEAKIIISDSTIEPVIDPEVEVREILPLLVMEKILNDSERFTIQVASFKLFRNASKEAETLQKKGFESFVLDKGKYSIVCVGKFTQKNEAKQFSGKLRQRYADFLVRRL